ncbi:MAG: hypothetical protein UV38_C0001G0275 [candidate division TM6 bacterium GW2011_GWE2_42_60]|nr:MAG: hypothetical protein UV38_C0001G0275 [candidate division TM6 bacterium GW2011_GWE2_42_60]HBY05532.1 hypothetical protein [Candidatus Dependentiae bacterium]
MKRLFFVISICFLVFRQTQAVPTRLFEGFDAILMPEYDFLDPLYGQLLAVKQELIENFYMSGEAKHPLTRLCLQLFFRREEDGFFAPTKKAEYVSTYLTPYDFGWVIALVLFKPDSFRDASLYSDCEKSTKVDQDVCAFLKKIREQQQEKGVKNLFKPSTVFKFINLIVEARNQAEKQSYDAAIPVHILLAAACMKSTSKADLLEIMRGIIEHTPPEKAVFKQEQKALFAKEKNNEINNEKKLFLGKIYEEKQAFEDFEALVNNETNKAPSRHALLLQNLMFSGFETVQMLVFRGSSDCTESGLVEFTRFLLDYEGTLDISLLPVHLQKHPFVVDFVGQFKGKSVNDETARTWFFDALSGKQTLVYKKKNQEIKALPENILQGLNLIFGTKAKEWKELGPALSTEERIVTFELKDSSKPTEGTIVLTITEKGTARTDELDVAPGHTEVVRAVDIKIVEKTEKLIKKFFGEIAIDSYPLCIFKSRSSLFESIGEKSQVNGLLTHALKTTGFGLYCKLLIDPPMAPIVNALFDPARVIPTSDFAGGLISGPIFQRYQDVPFSAYAARFPVMILKEALLGPQYQQNVLNFLQFLQTQKTLESNAGGLIKVFMDRYGIRSDIERFKNGALEKLLIQVAEKFPELFSLVAHQALWVRGDWNALDQYLAFEKFLVDQKSDFFSSSKTGTMHEFVLMQELKKPFLQAEVVSMVQAFGVAVLLDKKDLAPTMGQNALKDLHRFDGLIEDKDMKEVLADMINRFGNQERGSLLIFSLLSLERLVRQQNSQLKKEPHLLKDACRYFNDSPSFLLGLIAFDKKYPNELWSTMVDENKTFAEVFVACHFTSSGFQEFAKKGFVVPEEIQKAQKATPEERKKLLAGYRPSSEVFIDFAQALAAF